MCSPSVIVLKKQENSDEGRSHFAFFFAKSVNPVCKACRQLDLQAMGEVENSQVLSLNQAKGYPNIRKVSVSARFEGTPLFCRRVDIG
jgi:hypothetical protein